MDQCVAFKKFMQEHPIMDPKDHSKPLTVKIPHLGPIDATFIMKVLAGMKMQDIQSKYMACQRYANKHEPCPTTTTKFPPALKKTLIGAGKDILEGKKVQLTLGQKIQLGAFVASEKLKAASKKAPSNSSKPSEKFEMFGSGDVGSEGGSPFLSPGLAMLAGGMAVMAVAAFFVQRRRRDCAAALSADAAAREFILPDDVAEPQ